MDLQRCGGLAKIQKFSFRFVFVIILTTEIKKNYPRLKMMDKNLYISKYYLYYTLMVCLITFQLASGSFSHIPRIRLSSFLFEGMPPFRITNDHDCHRQFQLVASSKRERVLSTCYEPRTSSRIFDETVCHRHLPLPPDITKSHQDILH